MPDDEKGPEEVIKEIDKEQGTFSQMIREVLPERVTTGARLPMLNNSTGLLKGKYQPKLTEEQEDQLKFYFDSQRGTPIASMAMRCLWHDCQPPGSTVHTIKHGKVPIEELDPEVHRVIAFDLNNRLIRRGPHKAGQNPEGYEFTVSSREYDGLLYRLETDVGTYECTGNHLCIARWDDCAKNCFIVYLMEKGGNYRVGKTCLLVDNAGNGMRFGLASRARQERADKAWVLGVYETNTEALLAEEYYSVTWSVPKSLFCISTDRKNVKYNGLYKWVTQERLNAHHASLVKPFSHYKALLQSVGREIEYPMWEANGVSQSITLGKRTKRFNNMGSKNMLVLRACNVIDKYMSVPTVPGIPVMRSPKSGKQKTKRTGETPRWKPVRVTRREYSGMVYSLGVNRYKTYITDNVVTHNCDYKGSCPLYLMNAPSCYGEPCPVENALIYQHVEEYKQHLGIADSDLVDLAILKEYVMWNIIAKRVREEMAQDPKIFRKMFAGLDEEGNPQSTDILHPGFHMIDKATRTKQKLLESLMATREAKVKEGNKQRGVEILVEKIRDRAAKQIAKNKEEDG
jgi:hypothetical protein